MSIERIREQRDATSGASGSPGREGVSSRGLLGSGFVCGFLPVTALADSNVPSAYGSAPRTARREARDARGEARHGDDDLRTVLKAGLGYKGGGRGLDHE